MPGEQSVLSDEASKFRKILEKPSPDSTYSLRSELLSDGDSHKAHRAKTHRTSSHRRHRSRPSQERELDVTADATLRQARQLSRLLAHDEFEAVGLRRVLSQTAERLDQESRRAAEAETRAREADARVLALQAARHVAQADAQREKEALKAHQAQLEVARNEILRAQRELDSMAADKERAEQDAARERSRARAAAKEIEIQRARELGREEGKTQGYLDGRKEGWHLGTQRGIKEAYREMIYYDDASIDSRSLTPPLTGQLPRRSSQSTVTRPAAPRPGSVVMPLPDIVSEPRPSLRTAPSNLSHRRSGSISQSRKSHIRVNSDPKPSTVTADPIHDAPSTHHSERVEPITRPASSRLSPSASRERISPVPVQNRPSTPRHSANTPLPEGYIPLQENGRVSLPPPHGVELPPPSPHTPTIPLPMLVNDIPQSLHPLTPTANAAPTITVQEPTPPEPSMSMPEPHPAPAMAMPESPPLPALPTSGMERPNKGKQRQRMGPPRAGTGLHAPGRSSPSDTSTEFSQFEIVEQPERVRGPGLGRSNTSQLSIIMEGGSTVAESPEPERFPTPQVRGVPPTRNIPSRGPPAIPSQGILDDPREYAEFSPPLSPTQLAHRRVVAEQLRYSPSAENRDHARSTRDDVSIRSSTTRASAPRRRPNPTMPERLAASRDVAVLEKQAEMYDAFGTGRAFPSFDSQSSPEDGAVPARDFNKGHRRMSTATTVPEITIQPPSRPSSKGSKASAIGNRMSSESRTGPVPTSPVPSRPPSRRHSVQGSPLSPSRIPLPPTSGHVPMSLGTPHPADMDLPPGFVPTQGPPMTPSRVPLPQTVGQIPMSLNTPITGDFGLPLGFIPTQGPPEILEAFSSGALPKTPGLGALGLPSRTPHLTPATLPSLGLPSGFQGHTPSGIPLPLSTATTVRGLPSSRTPHLNPATLPSLGLPSGFQGHTPSGIPLPLSTATTVRGLPSSRTPHLNPATLPSLGLPPSFQGHTPSGTPLPLSTATTVRGLPNDMSPVPRGSGRTSYKDLPRAAGPMYEAAPLPPNFKYPSTPARMPLPESVAGSPQGSTAQTPFLGWGNSLADGAPGPSMSATLGRPMSLYAGDAGPNKKVSSTSLASSYKKFDASTYVDPAYLASSSALPESTMNDRPGVPMHSRAGSLRSTKTTKSKTKSPYAPSVETATDEDDPRKGKV